MRWTLHVECFAAVGSHRFVRDVCFVHEQLHVGDEVSFDTVPDTRSAKSGDLRAVRVKLRRRDVYTKTDSWTHAFVSRSKLPTPLEIIIRGIHPRLQRSRSRPQSAISSRPASAGPQRSEGDDTSISDAL